MIGSLTPNRITAAIDRTRPKVDALDAAKLRGLDDAMAIDASEHFQYQELQAWAHASGTIPTDEAQMLYIALGEVMSTSNGGWHHSVDTAEKVVLTQFISELLALKIKAARAAR